MSWENLFFLYLSLLLDFSICVWKVSKKIHDENFGSYCSFSQVMVAHVPNSRYHFKELWVLCFLSTLFCMKISSSSLWREKRSISLLENFHIRRYTCVEQLRTLRCTLFQSHNKAISRWTIRPNPSRWCGFNLWSPACHRRTIATARKDTLLSHTHCQPIWNRNHGAREKKKMWPR